MTATGIQPLTNAELAHRAHTVLEHAGVPAVTALRVVELLPPRGHHELTEVLTDDPGALSWLPALWTYTFANRFRTRSEGDAAEIQRLLGLAVTR